MTRDGEAAARSVGPLQAWAKALASFSAFLATAEPLRFWHNVFSPSPTRSATASLQETAWPIDRTPAVHPSDASTAFTRSGGSSLSASAFTKSGRPPSESRCDHYPTVAG